MDCWRIFWRWGSPSSWDRFEISIVKYVKTDGCCFVDESRRVAVKVVKGTQTQSLFHCKNSAIAKLALDPWRSG